MKLSTFIILLFLCNFTSAQSENAYKIEGKLVGVKDGSVLVLTHNIGTSRDTVGRSIIYKGHFLFNGSLLDEGEQYTLRLDTQLTRKGLTFFLESGNVKVHGTLKDWPLAIKIEGSEAHSDYMRLNKLLSPNKRKLNELSDSIFKLKRMSQNTEVLPDFDSTAFLDKIAELNKEFEVYLDRYYKTWTDFILSNLNSYYTPQSILRLLTVKSMDEIGKGFYDKLSPRVKTSFYGKELKKQIDIISGIGDIRTGQPIKDFTSKTIDGRLVSLKDYVSRNKLTLVDFWGSWCAPCREQIPNLKKIYNEFHEKGFNILGVCQEFTEAAWRKALEEENTPWINVSEISGRQETATRIYSVNAIPAYLLIDETGKIIEMDLPGSLIKSNEGSLRGSSLYNLVSKILSTD